MPESLRSPRRFFAGLAITASIGALGAMTLAAGCSGPDAPPPTVQAPLLEVREARAMLYPSSGAVYLTVFNSGTEGDRLLRVETDAARSAETHESVEREGTMRMVPHPEGFEIPAGGSLELAPGGKHVMLMGPREPAPPTGGTIRLTLHFERAGALAVDAAVARP